METLYGITTWGNGKRVESEKCDDQSTSSGDGCKYRRRCCNSNSKLSLATFYFLE